MTEKKCTLCNEIKPLESFAKGKSTNSTNFHAGVTPKYKAECKTCAAKRQKEWRHANPGYWKIANDKSIKGKINKYPEDERYLVSAIRTRISNAKQNSKRNPERDFNIDTDYMYDLFKEQKGKCPLTGIELLVDKSHPYSLSIDKIVPELGYTQGNVQWTCWAANRAKGDMSTSNFINMCKQVVLQSVETIEKGSSKSTE